MASRPQKTGLPVHSCSLAYSWRAAPRVWVQLGSSGWTAAQYRQGTAAAVGCIEDNPAGRARRSWAAEAPLMELTEDLFSRVQSDPSLLRNSSILAAFRAAPWLLPRRLENLPYAGLQNNLEALLRVQSQPAGRYLRAISLTLFSHHYSETIQNYVYSQVKLAGAPNFIALVFDEHSLEVCLDLNLPCYDATSYLSKPVPDEKEATYASATYHSIVWLKPVILLDVLERGYLVHVSDADIVYTQRDLWSSYLSYAEEVSAAGVFQREWPINTGNFLVLPTHAGRRLVRAWLDAMPKRMENAPNDQEGLSNLEGKEFVVCSQSAERCLELARVEGSKGGRRRPLVRQTRSALEELYGDNCAGVSPEKLWRTSLCHNGTQLYFHPVCITGASKKQAVFKAIGHWFLDSEEGCSSRGGGPRAEGAVGAGAAGGGSSGESGSGGTEQSAVELRVCKPLVWRRPEAEAVEGPCPDLAFRGEWTAGVVRGSGPWP